jgi:L-fucono-1,5-lactonase
VIDAHHHLWDPARRTYPWMDDPALAPIRGKYGIEDLRTVTAAAGIEQTIVVQAVGDAGETAELLAVAAESDGLVAGVVGWVDLTAPDVAATLARFDGRTRGMLLGVRHQVQDEPSPDWLTRDDVARGLEAVSRAEVVYDLLVRPDGLAGCIAAVDAHPSLHFVLDHAGKPPIAHRRPGSLDGWRTDLAELARRPNVTVKLSGLVTEADWTSWSPDDLAPVVDHLLSTFGPTRMMFGSDWPVCELAASYAEVVATATELLSRLGAAEREAVFGGTARRIYRLIPRTVS